MQRILTSFIFILITISVNAFELKSGQRVTIACDTSAVEPVVKSALKMLSDDIYHVLSADIVIGTKGSIIVKEDARALDNRKEAFRLKVSNRHIYIIGSDAHGIAYGLLEISRLMGV